MLEEAAPHAGERKRRGDNGTRLLLVSGNVLESGGTSGERYPKAELDVMVSSTDCQLGGEPSTFCRGQRQIFSFIIHVQLQGFQWALAVLCVPACAGKHIWLIVQV